MSVDKNWDRFQKISYEKKKKENQKSVCSFRSAHRVTLFPFARFASFRCFFFSAIFFRRVLLLFFSFVNHSMHLTVYDMILFLLFYLNYLSFYFIIFVYFCIYFLFP